MELTKIDQLGVETVPRSGVRGFRADRLREFRTRAGLSPDDLAARLNVSRQAVSTWELGRSTPPPDTLARLAVALDVSIGALIPIPESQLRLADLRVLAAMTQQQAAALLGVSPTVLSEIEHGSKRFTADRGARMADMYRVAPAVVEQVWARTVKNRLTRARSL